MEFDKKKLVEIAFKNISVGGLLADILDEILEPALKKVVEDTENTYDDALMAVYPLLSEQLKKVLEEEIEKLKDKLLGLDEPAAEPAEEA